MSTVDENACEAEKTCASGYSTFVQSNLWPTYWSQGTEGRFCSRMGKSVEGRPCTLETLILLCSLKPHNKGYHMWLAPKLCFVSPSNVVTLFNSSTPQPFKEQSESYTHLYWSGCRVNRFNTPTATVALSHIHVSIRPLIFFFFLFPFT